MKAIICLTIIELVCQKAAVAAVSETSGAGTTVQVTLKAMPYYLDTGMIRRSTDLFDPRLVLRNIVTQPINGSDPLHRATIEPWDILYGTTVTFVEVNATASRPATKGGFVIELIAETMNGGRRSYSATVNDGSPPTVSKPLTWTMPAFIYDTGCEPLKLSASVLIGDRVIAAVTKIVPFRCAE